MKKDIFAYSKNCVALTGFLPNTPCGPFNEVIMASVLKEMFP